MIRSLHKIYFTKALSNVKSSSVNLLNNIYPTFQNDVFGVSGFLLGN